MNTCAHDNAFTHIHTHTHMHMYMYTKRLRSSPSVPSYTWSVFGDLSAMNSVPNCSSAAQPGSQYSASAEQPGTQGFKMLLSKQCSKIGKFQAIVYEPWQDVYTYTWEGQPRTSTTWRSMLVSTEDPKLYCMGEFKLTVKNQAAFSKFIEKHKAGTTIVMSKIAFAEKTETQYIGCSLRICIDMAKRSLTSVVTSPSAVQPVPVTTVAETTGIQQYQFFDLTAFVLTCSPLRNGGDDRQAFDVELADGTKDAVSGKVQTMSLTIFASKEKISAMRHLCDTCCTEKVPMSFFQHQRSEQKDRGRQHWRIQLYIWAQRIPPHES